MYYVQGNVHDPDALNQVHAEAAASAVLLLPWAGHGSSPSQQDNSQEMVDAYVLSATRSLRGLNPSMQVWSRDQAFSAASLVAASLAVSQQILSESATCPAAGSNDLPAGTVLL